jgi:protection-of-telomeres protein 1
MFSLWGDLEEQIAATLPPDNIDDIPPSTLATSPPASSPVRRAGDQPDADDSENEEGEGQRQHSAVLAERDPNIGMATDQVATNTLKAGNVAAVVPKNKPFACCIKQYGAKVRETDRSKADAGDGKRWQRRFALFGTTIL